MPPSYVPPAPPLPFPISRISQKVERYFLYSADIITWLRREHHILGVLIGTLAQIPQQNVFLGIPLELQPEEARLLVEEGLAYIVDDLQWHSKRYSEMTREEREAYKANLRHEGEKLAKANLKESQKRSEQALRKRQQQQQRHSRGESEKADLDSAATPTDAEGLPEEDCLFGVPQPRTAFPSPSLSQTSSKDVIPFSIIPSTSQSLLPPSPTTTKQGLPTVNPASYALFKHLYKEGYFLSPGLRFGCQFLVYPGDPLRFHSHFLAVGADWDEDIDLLDMVGGGRLGTGVKKSWLIGGPCSSGVQGQGTEIWEQGEKDDVAETGAEARAFCIEWGGM